ncbi:uncharacterized protein EI90DRAFT_3015521 [Cantharellus anzutake]|uniref:uncharacterized protein n=1 Tax=Cantharellus anzutake TaxID=1750568 RepID=UPI001904CA0D|nr:uncharacterized protein EI90DRAFT_3015521 [Cantharellus anzutake]KAF8333058.1 hypothetical protein EI90DRAFT_3015521 [Cantharellus anzutake]
MITVWTRTCIAVRNTFGLARQIFKRQNLAAGCAAYDDHHHVFEVRYTICGGYSISRGWCHDGTRVVPAISKHNVVAYIHLGDPTHDLGSWAWSDPMHDCSGSGCERSKCLMDQMRVSAQTCGESNYPPIPEDSRWVLPMDPIDRARVALPMAYKPQAGCTVAPAQEGGALSQREDLSEHAGMLIQTPATSSWWNAPSPVDGLTTDNIAHAGVLAQEVDKQGQLEDPTSCERTSTGSRLSIVLPLSGETTAWELTRERSEWEWMESLP